MKIIDLNKSSQKFESGLVIYVPKITKRHKSHFTSEAYGVVDRTYSQLYGGDNTDSYALYLLTDRGWNRISWYDEEDIRVVEDEEKCEEIEESFREYLENGRK